MELRWRPSPARLALCVGTAAYAYFLIQGIPLWDDDYTSWVVNNGLLRKWVLDFVLEVLSPVSRQVESWGFQERPLQSLVYKLCYSLSGFDAWSYAVFKCAVYAALGVMIHRWGERVAGPTTSGLPMLAGAALFVLAPSVTAAHILIQDFGPAAELLFVALAWLGWHEIERTPPAWRGLPQAREHAQLVWLGRWTAFALLVFVAYKSKADLKLLPCVLGAYVLVYRRRQVFFFALPLGFMLLLAVPWGPGILGHRPPFLPTSAEVPPTYMWAPARLDSLIDYLWAREPYDFCTSLQAAPLSLAGVLGPFLLAGLALAAVISMVDPRPPEAAEAEGESARRARVFVGIWLAAVLLATSALPRINPTFRVRYGIIPLVPCSILLAWGFEASRRAVAARRPWVPALVALLVLLQAGVNLNRSLAYRRRLGTVMVAVDEAYAYVARYFPHQELALAPDFLPYAVRPDAPLALQRKRRLGTLEELRTGPFPAGRTFVLSWLDPTPETARDLDVLAHFSGCRPSVFFDRLFPCAEKTGARLFRYAGSIPAAGDLGTLAELAAGLDAVGQRAAARPVWRSVLELATTAHDEHSVVAVRARLRETDGSTADGSMVAGLDCLYLLGEPERAAQWFRRVLAEQPRHYGANYQLAAALDAAGRRDEARAAWATVLEMARTYRDQRVIETAERRLVEGS